MSENFYCVKCGGFIKWDFSSLLTTSPPKHKGKCTDCGEIVYQFTHKIKKEKDHD